MRMISFKPSADVDNILNSLPKHVNKSEYIREAIIEKSPLKYSNKEMKQLKKLVG